MTTKSYLRQIYWLSSDINNKMLEIAEIKSLVYGITAFSGDSDKVRSSLKGDTIGEMLSKLENEEKELNNKIARYFEIKRGITSQIDSLENGVCRCVLTKKYVLNMSLEEIAVNLGYGYRQVKRYHSRALHDFEEKYGESYKDVL